MGDNYSTLTATALAIAAFTAAFTAAIGSAAVTAPGAGATSVLFMSGTGGTSGDVTGLLGGSYRDSQVRVVDYPAAMWPATGILDPTFGMSVAAGIANLTTAARSTTGPLVIAGFSQGAVVVQNAAADLNQDPVIPSDTTFVMIGNPNLGLFAGGYGQQLPVLDFVPEPLPETRFNVIVVVNEYDAWADPIARPDNPLTVLNAVMAMVYVHPAAQNTDLSDVPPQNITTEVNRQGGTTTTYLVPTKQLPLTTPLRQLGMPDPEVDELDRQLRPVIDSGYARNAAAPGAKVSPASSVSAGTNAVRARLSARRGSSSPPAATGTSAPRSPAR